MCGISGYWGPNQRIAAQLATGIVVPVGDARTLANELRVLIEDPELRTTLGTAAQKYVKQNFQQSEVWAMSKALYARGHKQNG